MEGTSLGGELVLVSACLTVSPLITGGQAHTHTTRILLGLADIKACFLFAQIHADMTGAFGFIVDELFNLAMAMVFGSTASASSWEAF